MVGDGGGEFERARFDEAGFDVKFAESVFDFAL